MTEITQAEFARQNKWSRSHVTGLKQAGRLVMTEDGKHVLVKESLARIEATRDPNRDDVAERHAAERAAVSTPAAPAEERVTASYQQSRAVKERYLALQAKAEYEERIALLVKAEDVKRAFSAQWTQLRIAMDHARDQMAADLAAESDSNVIHAMLGEHFEQLQSEFCRALSAWSDKEKTQA